MAMKWGTGGHMLFWPDVATVDRYQSRPSWARTPVEYTEDVRSKRVLSFPSCSGVHAGNDPDWRYLDQVGPIMPPRVECAGRVAILLQCSVRCTSKKVTHDTLTHTHTHTHTYTHTHST